MTRKHLVYGQPIVPRGRETVQKEPLYSTNTIKVTEPALITRNVCTKDTKYSKTCAKRPLSKRPKNGFQTNNCLMQVKSIAECSNGEHSTILSNFIKLSVVIQISVLSIFE